jgi:hypothetical protein
MYHCSELIYLVLHHVSGPFAPEGSRPQFAGEIEVRHIGYLCVLGCRANMIYIIRVDDMMCKYMEIIYESVLWAKKM